MASPAAWIDGVLAPLDAVSPQLGIGVAALATAALAVPVYRLTTRPAGLVRARHRALGDLLGAIVFRHDPVVVFRSLGCFARSLAVYLGHSLLPLVVLALPLGLFYLALDARYGHAPFLPGEVARVAAPAGPRPDVQVSEGLEILTPAVPRPDGGWACRLLVRSEGVHEVEVGSRSSRVVAAPGVSRDVGGELEIEYRARDLRAGPFAWPWWAWYLADVLVLGWALAATFGIEI